MELKLALKIHDIDNVATIFANDVTAGTVIDVRDKKGQTQQVEVKSDIPYGHKIALTKIRAGEMIVKYGEEIGIATQDIEIGAHVHVHNLDSMRCRGDLEK